MKCGVSLSHSRGRPTSTTQEAGYGVSHSSGRPSGTTQEAGYGISSGRRSIFFLLKKSGCLSTTPIIILRLYYTCTCTAEEVQQGQKVIHLMIT